MSNDDELSRIRSRAEGWSFSDDWSDQHRKDLTLLLTIMDKQAEQIESIRELCRSAHTAYEFVDREGDQFDTVNGADDFAYEIEEVLGREK